MSRQDASHGLKFQARAIAAQAAEKSKSQWLAGTNALREENEVRTSRRLSNAFDIKALPVNKADLVGLPCSEHAVSAMQVQVLELDGDRNVLKVTGAYTHAPEIWCIAPSPSNLDHFATVFNKGKLSATLLSQHVMQPSIAQQSWSSSADCTHQRLHIQEARTGLQSGPSRLRAETSGSRGS